MYSIVLMTAMTTGGPMAPAFGDGVSVNHYHSCPANTIILRSYRYWGDLYRFHKYGGSGGPVYSGPPPIVAAPIPPKAETPKVSGRIIIEVPTDAKVYFDDRLMKSTSEERVYRTPKLDQGDTYFYDVRVVVARDGQVLEDTQRVVVKAGETQRVGFPALDRKIAQVVMKSR